MSKTKRDQGKGSDRRPGKPGAYEEGWERVFGKGRSKGYTLGIDPSLSDQPDETGFARSRRLKDGEECNHRGCKAHISHPCEGCGRIGARGSVRIWEGVK